MCKCFNVDQVFFQMPDSEGVVHNYSVCSQCKDVERFETQEEREADLPLLVREHWPHHLKKALIDPFDYMLQLKNGLLIRFHDAEIECDGEWVRLRDRVEFCNLPERQHWDSVDTGRGLEVRVSEIVWVLDAPSGS